MTDTRPTVPQTVPRTWYDVPVNGHHTYAYLAPHEAARWPGAVPADFDPRTRLVALVRQLVGPIPTAE